MDFAIVTNYLFIYLFIYFSLFDSPVSQPLGIDNTQVSIKSKI